MMQKLEFIFHGFNSNWTLAYPSFYIKKIIRDTNYYLKKLENYLNTTKKRIKIETVDVLKNRLLLSKQKNI